MGVRKVRAAFPKLNSHPESGGRHRPMGEALFLYVCRRTLCKLSWFSDLLRPRKVLYRDLVERNDSACHWVRFAATENGHQDRVISITEFSFTRWLAQNVLPFIDVAFIACMAEMLDYAHCRWIRRNYWTCILRYCERVYPFWDYIGEMTGCIDTKRLGQLDLAKVVDNPDPPRIGVKQKGFLVILAVARLWFIQRNWRDCLTVWLFPMTIWFISISISLQ